MEEWRMYPKLPNYEVSSLGKVRHIQKGNLLALNLRADGHLGVTMQRDGKSCTPTLNRIVAETFLPAPTDTNMVAQTINQNKQDCRVENLIWQKPRKVDNSHRPGLMHQYESVAEATDDVRVYTSKGDAILASGVGRKRFDTAVTNNAAINGFKWRRSEKVQPAKDIEIREIEDREGCKVSADGLIWKKRTGWTRGSLTSCGMYYRVTFGKEEERVSRIVASAFKGDAYFEEAEVNHINGRDTLNNHVDNLEWVTQSENG
jgi:HNH endonuclease/NUMOD4 motif